MSALYRLKNILVRRFDCISVKDKADKIIIEYKYKNYLMFNKDYFAVRIQNKTVPVTVEKSGANRVRVEIDKDLLKFESKETFIKINCFYNGPFVKLSATVPLEKLREQFSSLSIF